jgi:hypothetical protein
MLETTFWEVIWWMIIVFFAAMFIWMFIAVFADIFGRRDLSGFSKAIWILFIFLLPLLGILLYMIFRPAPTEEEIHAVMERNRRAAGISSTDEIARAHQLLQTGAITQTEFDTIKQRALG